MTPQEREQFNQMKRELETLKQFKANLEFANKIPLAVDQAFRRRFVLTTLNSSTKSATSENQAVDEGSSGTYSVLKPPDGFDQRDDNGTTKYYPYYT